jgi:hypothetical protein
MAAQLPGGDCVVADDVLLLDVAAVVACDVDCALAILLDVLAVTPRDVDAFALEELLATVPTGSGYAASTVGALLLRGSTTCLKYCKERQRHRPAPLQASSPLVANNLAHRQVSVQHHLHFQRTKIHLC